MTSALNISKFALNDNRKDLVFLARQAETAERYEDMCLFMRTLVNTLSSTKADLSVEERNLLSVAYKNVVGARRATWRTLNVDEFKDNEAIKTYKRMIEIELENVCLEVINLLQNTLIPAQQGGTPNFEAEVFYLKMAGDYYRYLAEFIDKPEYVTQAGSFYQQAIQKADTSLPPTNPIRLGLSLNASVFQYEIAKDHKKAIEMAKSAFDSAISKLDQLDEASYKDSTLIMQLLRDNLTLWTSDQEQLSAEDVDDQQ